MRPQRIARPAILKELSFSEEEMDSEITHSSTTETANDVVEVVDNSSVINSEDPNARPILSQNAKEFDLNHFKQYTKRIEFANRDTFKIHDKNLRPKDQGSKDKGLVYVSFNAGMFEAIKKNVMRILKNTFGATITKQPKIEYYGAAEERINLDLQVALNGESHDLKIKVHNTTCALDVQALGVPLKTTFPHLSGLTCAEYFCLNIRTKVVEILKDAAKKDKVNRTCVSCEKDCKNSETVKCHMCKKHTHKPCALKTISDVSLDRAVVKNAFVCEKCFLQPEYNDDYEDIPNQLKKLSFLSLEVSNETAITQEIADDEDLNQHVEQEHTSLAIHKRKRMETSLLVDATCGECDKLIESKGIFIF